MSPKTKKPSASTKKQDLMTRLKKGPVICAEGYVFEMERRGYMQAGNFVPTVVLDYPEVVEQFHRELVRAGSDVVLALTYYTHREKLKVIGREGDLDKLNRKAIEIAKKVANETNTLVAGGICNTWVYDPAKPKESAKAVRDQYIEQVVLAKEMGVDYMVAETIEYYGEAQVALEILKEYDFPVVLTAGAMYDKTLDGMYWPEALQKLEEAGADVVGYNCIRGPGTIMSLLQETRSRIKGYLAAVPVPYDTTWSNPTFHTFHRKDGKNSYTADLDEHLIGRYEVEKFTKEALELGVNYFGLCCGNAAHYTRTMAEALGRVTEASQFSPKMSTHAFFAGDESVAKHNKREGFTGTFQNENDE